MIKDGIIITFPVQFLLDLYESLNMLVCPGAYSTKTMIKIGFKECMRQLETVRKSPDNNVWYHSIGTKPTQDVLYAYITILGKIRYRGTIAAWEKGGIKQFNDGRKRTAKHWLVLSDLVAAPQEIKCKGFQGFRYTDKLF